MATLVVDKLCAEIKRKFIYEDRNKFRETGSVLNKKPRVTKCVLKEDKYGKIRE